MLLAEVLVRMTMNTLTMREFELSRMREDFARKRRTRSAFASSCSPLHSSPRFIPPQPHPPLHSSRPPPPSLPHSSPHFHLHIQSNDFEDRVGADGCQEVFGDHQPDPEFVPSQIRAVVRTGDGGDGGVVSHYHTLARRGETATLDIDMAGGG